MKIRVIEKLVSKNAARTIALSVIGNIKETKWIIKKNWNYISVI